MSYETNENLESSASPSNQLSRYDNQIELRELIKVLWRGKFWIIGVTFIAAVTSVFMALSLPNIYRAEMLLAVDEGDSGGLAGLAAQYGGIAGLAGISLPSFGTGDKNVGLAKLQSRQFITDFLENHNILPELMAVEAYNRETGELVYDSEVYDELSNTWVRDVQPPLLNKPSDQEATLVFQGILGVSENIETGFVTVSIDHFSPLIAYEWVTWLVDDLNREMMLEAVAEAQQSVDYLTEQLASTQVVALEQVFYSLIEEQMKTIMLANSRPEYLFKTIDPAIAPEMKFRPRRALICILGTLLGGMLGVAGVLVRQYAFRN